MLKGERVTLRPFRREDIARWHEFTNDVEIELLSGGDVPRPQVLEAIEGRYTQESSNTGSDSVMFAIEADEKFIGFCALFHYDNVAHTCELGIIIGDRAYWGRGYGRESINLLVEYAFRLRNFRKVWLTTRATNERAIRAYRACGFIEEGRLRAHEWSAGEYVDVVYMGLLRDEWQSRPTSPEARA
jgi:RimJ/RimL family protein N-acetyltransferase